MPTPPRAVLFDLDGTLVDSAPDLCNAVNRVLADLGRLAEIKAQAQDEEANLRANLSILEEEQLRVGTLMAARRQGDSSIGPSSGGSGSACPRPAP